MGQAISFFQGDRSLREGSPHFRGGGGSREFCILQAGCLASLPSQLPQGWADCRRGLTSGGRERRPSTSHPGSGTRPKAWPGGRCVQPPKMATYASPGSEEQLRGSLEPHTSPGAFAGKRKLQETNLCSCIDLSGAQRSEVGVELGAQSRQPQCQSIKARSLCFQFPPSCKKEKKKIYKK